jgi:hypothetical protein
MPMPEAANGGTKKKRKGAHMAAIMCSEIWSDERDSPTSRTGLWAEANILSLRICN